MNSIPRHVGDDVFTNASNILVRQIPSAFLAAGDME
jgi:hypothetical protein